MSDTETAQKPKTERVAPLDFITAALAAADGMYGREAAIFERELNLIFVAAIQDPEIELALVLRKKDDVAIIGVKNGEQVGNQGIKSILLPIALRL